MKVLNVYFELIKILVLCGECLSISLAIIAMGESSLKNETAHDEGMGDDPLW